MSKQTKEAETVFHSELDDPTTVHTPVLVDRVRIYGSDELLIMSFEVAMPDQGYRIEICRLAMTTKVAATICRSLAALTGDKS